MIVRVTSAAVAILENTSWSRPSAFLVGLKEKLQKDVEELLGTDGVLLYPSHTRVAPKHHHALFQPLDFTYTGTPRRR